jgi:hypothetical protein
MPPVTPELMGGEYRIDTTVNQGSTIKAIRVGV